MQVLRPQLQGTGQSRSQDVPSRNGARPGEDCRVQQSNVHQGVCVVSRCCCLIASDAVVPGTQVPSTRLNAAWTTQSDSCVNSD